MRLSRVVPLVALLSVSACGNYAYDPYYYDAAYFDPSWSGWDASMAYTWADPSAAAASSALTATPATAPGALDLSATAARVAGAANGYYLPAGCAHASASNDSVDFAFDNCTGQHGIKSINGHLSLRLSEANGQLVLTASSSDLKVDERSFLVDSVTTVTQAGGQPQAVIASRSRGPDVADSREAQTTVSWQTGSACITVDGHGTTSRGSMRATSSLTGHRLCTGQCPTAGVIKVTNNDGKQLSANFDGTSTLKVAAEGSRTRSYDLQCP